MPQISLNKYCDSLKTEIHFLCDTKREIHMGQTIKSTENILPHHLFVLEEYRFQTGCLNFQINSINIYISNQLIEANHATISKH